MPTRLYKERALEWSVKVAAAVCRRIIDATETPQPFPQGKETGMTLARSNVNREEKQP